jgi:hypothetical protein
MPTDKSKELKALTVYLLMCPDAIVKSPKVTEPKKEK